MTNDVNSVAKAAPSALDDAALEQVTGGGVADKAWQPPPGHQLNGGIGDDTLYGRAENDTLKGGTGDDRLEGGEGNDLMQGGYGDDTFVINLGGEYNRGDGNDTILGQRGTNIGEWLSRGDVDTIVFKVPPFMAGEVRVEFSKGGFVGEMQPDGTRQLQTNSAGTIYYEGGSVEFRGIERFLIQNE